MSLIDYLELLAAMFVVKAFATNIHIHLKMENRTAAF